jgi:hypothetical protein
LLAGALVVAAAGANAVPYELIYTGNVQQHGVAEPGVGVEPHVLRRHDAVHDHRLLRRQQPEPAAAGAAVPRLPRLRADSATIRSAATTYSIETAADQRDGRRHGVDLRPHSGIQHGRYGIGLIANVLADGAGIVGDFARRSPEFTVNALTPTTFTDYFGVGHGSGPCISGQPPACPHLDTPWVLRDAANVAWNLTLGNYEEDYPALAPGQRSHVRRRVEHGRHQCCTRARHYGA